MIGKLALTLALLTIVNARPNRHNDGSELTEPHEWCPDYRQHYLLPHEYDCTKFYYCEYGQKYIEPRVCSPGTVFSFDEQVCIHPTYTSCWLPGFPQTPPPETGGHPEEGSPELEQVPEASPEVERPEESSPEAPENGLDNGENGHPDNGERPEAHPESEPDNGTDENTDNGEHGPDNGENGHPDNGERPEVEWLPNGCPADYYVDKLFPHPAECGKYLICVYGEKVERDCPAGLHFNSDIKDCDWPENVDCNGNGESPGPEEHPDSHPEAHPESEPDNGTDENTDNGEHGPDNGENGHPDNGERPEAHPESEPDNGTDENTDNGEDNEQHVPDNGENGHPDNGERPEVEWLPNGCPADYYVDKLFPHPAECGKYLICVYGEKVERDCPAGLHFNPDIKDCDWPKNVDCNGNDGPEEHPDSRPEAHPESEPDNGTDENTDHGEDDEEHGPDNGENGHPGNGERPEAHPESEPDNGTDENTDIGEHGPDNGENGHPDNGERPEAHPESEPDNGTDENTDNGEDNEQHGPDNGENGHPDNGERPDVEWLPNGCPADYYVDKLFPHPADCGKYLICVYGEKVERDCPAGLHFNPDTKDCDWPKNVDCNGNGNGNGENPGPEEHPENHPEAHPESEPDNGTDENTENGEDNGQHGPDNGENYPDNDNTDNGTDENTDNGENHPDHGGNGPDNGARPEVEWLDNGCPADWHIHHLVPHEADCGKFYYCVYGELVERECSGGLHFNPVLQVCDWPKNAGCQNGGDNGDNPGFEGHPENGTDGEDEDNNENSDGGNGEHGPDNGENHPDNGNTDNGIDENTDNGEDNGENHPEHGGNGPDNGARPEVEWLDNGCPADWHIHHLVPHEADCGKFYYCVYGELVERECSGGLHFNPVLQVCDWPQEAGCQLDDGNNGNGDGGYGEHGPDNGENHPDNGNTDNGTDENTDNEENHPDHGHPDTDNGNNGHGEEDNTDGNGNENGSEKPDHNRCRECNAGDWAHETDCGKYWRCEGDRAVLLSCAEGLHFNKNTKACDFVANAGCTREF